MIVNLHESYKKPLESDDIIILMISLLLFDLAQISRWTTAHPATTRLPRVLLNEKSYKQ